MEAASQGGTGSANTGYRARDKKKLPGPNDPCHCGSGKKYKKCHMAEDEAKAAMEELQANPPSVSATADIEKLTGRISALEGKVQANAQLQINDDAFQQMQAKVNALAEQVVALSEANAKLVEQLQEVETQREEETDEFTQRMEAISNNIQRASLFRKAESPKEGAPAVSAQAAIEEAAAGKNVVKSEGMDAILAKYQKGATAKN